MTEKQETKGEQLAITKKDVVDIVTTRVGQLVSSGELHLPENYSAENSLKAAWLALQEVVDKNDKPALSVCTNNSVANALLSMIILGLNPAKTQCYFVVFGKTLVCMRNAKHGSIALVKRVLGEEAEVWDECVYEGDVFEYSIEHGHKVVTKHEQKLENIDIAKILAAYAVLEPGNGKARRTEIMTKAQIDKAWQQGQAKGKSKAHTNFTDEMCRKTVVNRLCKAVINSSDDRYLVRVFKEQEVAMAAATTEAVAELEANATVIDFDQETEVKDVSPPAKDDGPHADDNTAPPEPEPTMTEEEPEDPPTATPTPPAQPGDYPEDEPEKRVVDESVVPAPKTLFNNFIEEQEFNPSLARKVAASMVKLDDVRKLSNADYVDVLGDMARFLTEYKKLAGADEQPNLNGTL